MMGTVKKTQNVGYIGVGSTYTIEVSLVENLNYNLVGGVVVDLTIPVGVAYQSSVLPQGVFVGGLTNEWQVGTVLPGQSIVGTFTFIVTDASALPYVHLFEISAQTGCNACFTNDALEVTITAVSCNEVQDCLAGLTKYDDDTAALAGGLVGGDLYQTTGSGSAPLNAEGLVKIIPYSSSNAPSSSLVPPSSSTVASSSAPASSSTV